MRNAFAGSRGRVADANLPRNLCLAALVFAAGWGCDLGERLADAGGGTDAAWDAADGDAADGTGRHRWPGGLVKVLVMDLEGQPLADAFVMTGGSPEWMRTDAVGGADVKVGDDGKTDRWLLAAKRGWRNGGTDIDDWDGPPEVVTIAMERLPDADNTRYVFTEAGDSSSMNTLFCGHCHKTIADQWKASRHRSALDNPRTRDLWNGSALSAQDRPSCDALGGAWLASRVAGQADGTLERCYVGRGVLPDLNHACGRQGQPPCDHPDVEAESLGRLGHCGDCHGAAIPGAEPGHVNLNDALGYTFREGVSCDLCHKIADVTVGPLPGLDGAIRLLRPSEPSDSPMWSERPITFGPYPDVLNPAMGASYQPQFRTSELCSACHEYAQEALMPSDENLVDRERWPDGVPVHTTYSEWAASAYAAVAHCQSCHMPALFEDTAIGNLRDLHQDPSIAVGWIRRPGEIRAHSFVGPEVLAADAITLEVTVAERQSGAVATATITNLGAGHAIPTGEPMRQLVVLVTATIDGEPVGAMGGRAVSDVGGALAIGSVGASVAVQGRDVTWLGQTISAPSGALARFVRPSGLWDDYDGPGVGWFSEPGRTAEDKGLEIDEVIDEVAVAEVSGEVAILEREPADVQDGDRVYLVTAGQWAGAAGALYAKVLVDSDGNRGVAHYRAVDVASDNRLAAQDEESSTHLFPMPQRGQELLVTARAVYRRAFDSLAQSYGWPAQDLELGTDDARLER